MVDACSGGAYITDSTLGASLIFQKPEEWPDLQQCGSGTRPAEHVVGGRSHGTQILITSHVWLIMRNFFLNAAIGPARRG